MISVVYFLHIRLFKISTYVKVFTSYRYATWVCPSFFLTTPADFDYAKYVEYLLKDTELYNGHYSSKYS
jgi:hypothetical protein